MMQYLPETQMEPPVSGTFIGLNMGRVLDSYQELVLRGEMLRGVPSGTSLYVEAEHLPDFHSPTGAWGDHYFDSLVTASLSTGTTAAFAPWYIPGSSAVPLDVNSVWPSYVHCFATGNNGVVVQVAHSRVSSLLAVGGSVTAKFSMAGWTNNQDVYINIYNAAATYGVSAEFVWSANERYSLSRYVASVWTYAVATFLTNECHNEIYLHLERIADGVWVMRGSRGGLSWVRVGAYTFASPFTPYIVAIQLSNNGATPRNAFGLDWVRFNWIYFGV